MRYRSTSPAIAAILAILTTGCGSEEVAAPLSDAAPSASSEPDASATSGDGDASITTPTSTSDEEQAMQAGASDDESGMNGSDVVRPPANRKNEPVLPRPSFPRPVAGAMVAISAGTFLRGSAPEDTLREHFAENDNIPTTMTAFEIDALPYPNDPSRPHATGVTLDQAAALCAEQGKRLCTELEWEWACRGADNRRYPTGTTYDPTAYSDSDPTAPSSPFGVFAMGRILEWTRSRWGVDPDQVERAAIRGYADDELSAGKQVGAAVGRRCAKRWHSPPDRATSNLGFRCCRGPANEESCFIERTRPPQSLYNNMKPDKFAKVIRSIPELSMIHDNPRMFSDTDIRAVLARRGTDRNELARQGIHFRWKPVRWIPRQGMELWVAVGRSARHTFVVALHEVEDNEKYVHATALILWNQVAPIALAYREGHRDQLYWTPCWNCRDGGTVEFDDEKNEVVITHKW